MGIFFTNTREEVMDWFDDFKIKTSDLTSEKNVENIIVKELRRDYEKVHQQFHIGGYLGLKVDIDINEEIGIEIKLAKDLDTADKIHRLFGQAVYYRSRKYGDNLIVLIVGPKKYCKNPMMEEIMEMLSELEIEVVYLITKGKEI